MEVTTLYQPPYFLKFILDKHIFPLSYSCAVWYNVAPFGTVWHSMSRRWVWSSFHAEFFSIFTQHSIFSSLYVAA